VCCLRAAIARAFWALPILSVQIPVSSYVISTPPEPSFLDSTGTQLTDRIFGDPNINQNSNGWVGWINASGVGPNAFFITFKFGSVQTIKLTQNFVFSRTPCPLVDSPFRSTRMHSQMVPAVP
jgi:hypothetical protein